MCIVIDNKSDLNNSKGVVFDMNKYINISKISEELQRLIQE